MKADPDRPKPHGFFLVLLAGCILALAPIVNKLVAFREFDLDLRFAVFDALISLVSVGIFLLPIHLGLLFLIRGKHLRPLYRLILVLSPTFVFILPRFVVALVRPVDSEKSFAERMKHPLPADATGWRAWYSHSPGESSYMFCFSTTPASTRALLASGSYTFVEAPMMLEPANGEPMPLPIGGYSVPRGWPKPKSWDGLKVYFSRKNNGYCYILTDGTKSRVFIMVGDT
ncbi:MAG: hypothetical protein V4689_05600 [Verrucomicrobiota bacterium]